MCDGAPTAHCALLPRVSLTTTTADVFGAADRPLTAERPPAAPPTPPPAERRDGGADLEAASPTTATPATTLLGAGLGARRLSGAARRLLHAPLLPAAPSAVRERYLDAAERRGSSRLAPLLVRWRTRLCLLQMYGTLSILLSITAAISASHDREYAEDEDGVQSILRHTDRLTIFAHALVLLALFGLTDEVVGPLWSRLRRCLASALVGDSAAEITAFPRTVSGFWG